MILDVDRAGAGDPRALPHKGEAERGGHMVQHIAERDAIERGVRKWQPHAVVDPSLDIERLEKAILDVDRRHVRNAEQVLHGLRDDSRPAANVEYARVRRIPQCEKGLQQHGLVGGSVRPIEGNVPCDQSLHLCERHVGGDEVGLRCRHERLAGEAGGLRTIAHRLARKFPANRSTVAIGAAIATGHPAMSHMRKSRTNVAG